ncbi:hypothetical protein [Enterococcus larvae]|uniref:hypothetical protein n=1 Tax=Enterococcus larvae TaxID=2794352 RepID=UPI003F677745
MGKIVKSTAILLLELITQVTAAPVLLIVISKSNYLQNSLLLLTGVFIVSAIVSIIIKLKVVNFVSIKILGHPQDVSRLKKYYYVVPTSKS